MNVLKKLLVHACSHRQLLWLTALLSACLVLVNCTSVGSGGNAADVADAEEEVSTVSEEDFLSDSAETAPELPDADTIVSSADSPEQMYRGALQLLQAGRMQDFRSILFRINQDFPDFALGTETARWVDSPFVLAREIAEQRVEAWIGRPSEVPPFTQERPAVPELPPVPVLTKGEFETSAAFDARFARAQEDYDRLVEDLREQYFAEVEAFNSAVEAYNAEVSAEYAARIEASSDLLWTYVNEAVQQILGRPLIVEPYYNADEEQFAAGLVSANGNFEQDIRIQVPLEEAPDFAENISQARPVLFFELAGNAGMRISRVLVVSDGKEYVAAFTDRKELPVEVQRGVLASGEIAVDLPFKRLERIDYKSPF